MDSRHLRNFILVAEELSITRAAERLAIAQPSLSVQMQRLEDEVGAPLFERQGRGIGLTTAGALFLERAKRVLGELEQGFSVARRAAKGEIGRLSIGYDAPAEFRVFPRTIPPFRRTFPDVEINFRNAKNAEVFDALARDEIDVGFAYLPIPAEFEYHVLTDVTLILAVPTDHRLAAADEVSIRDLSGEPLIMFPREIDPDSYAQIEAVFTAQGAIMNLAKVTATLLTGINFVSMGIGCCLVGDYAERVRWDGVIYRKLAAGSLVKTLAIVTRPGRRSPLIDSFVQLVVSHLADERAKGCPHQMRERGL